ncbi:MAG TPA: EamA family transporter [Thermoanaerobaculia bacterium]
MRVPSRPVTWASLAALILIWGTTWAAIRISLQGIPPIAGVALRFAIASAALLALVPFFKVRLGATRRERGLWLINALFTFCISYGILYWGEQWVPSGLAAVLFATFPLFVAVIAHFVLPGERLTRRSAVGVLVGFAGVAIIFSEDFRALLGPKVAFAAAVILICPLSSAIGSVAVKKWGEGIHPLSTAAMPMGLCALILGPVAWIAEADRGVSFGLAPTLALFYLALVGSALPFTLYFWLLKHHAATRLSLINYAVPVVAVIVGSVFLDEPITVRMILGAALVIAGVAVAMRTRTAVAEAAP